MSTIHPLFHRFSQSIFPIHSSYSILMVTRSSFLCFQSVIHGEVRNVSIRQFWSCHCPSKYSLSHWVIFSIFRGSQLQNSLLTNAWLHPQILLHIAQWLHDIFVPWSWSLITLRMFLPFTLCSSNFYAFFRIQLNDYFLLGETNFSRTFEIRA